MTKRRLTQQQKNRIKQRNRQINRQWHSQSQTASTHDTTCESSSNSAEASGKNAEPSFTIDNKFPDAAKGLVVAHYGTQIGIITDAGVEKRCHKHSNVPDVVAGDQILWQQECDQLGVIVGLRPRQTELMRADHQHKLKLVAANVDSAFIVFAPLPDPSQWLTDSYIVAAIAAGIEPILVLNKCDLTPENAASEALKLFQLYQGLGYTCIKTSTVSVNGMAEMKATMLNKSAIIAGQSGVGKSSLINALLGDSEAKVGPLSNQTQLGTHTTVMAQLYALAGNSQLIDSPGIREFSLSALTRTDIYKGFPEIANRQAECKFRNCAHQSEPGCALLSALNAGLIEPSRLDHFKRLLQECHG